MRKAIQLSESTLVVSLPAKWVKAKGIVKGSELRVEEADEGLLISSSTNEFRESTIDFGKLSPRLCWASLDAAYIAGNKRITIIKGNETVDVTKMTRYFPGMIIVEEKRNTLVLESIESEEINFDILVGRIYNLTLDIISDSLNAIKEKDKSFFTRVKHRDYTLNSYVSMALRYSMQKRILGAHFAYVKTLEMFADKLCKYLQEKPNTNFLLKLQQYYERVRKLHMNFSEENLVSLSAREDHELFDLLFEIQELELLLNEMR